MTREEMLNKLHKIKIGAQPTVITDDMGLQYEYVTPEGYGEGFGDMGDWPFHKIENVSQDDLSFIKDKIQNNCLTVEDIENTAFEFFFNFISMDIDDDENDVEISNFFKDLSSVETSEDGVVYAFCDAGQWEPEVYFYNSYDEIEEAFVNMYVTYVDRWEDLSSEELEDWLLRVEELNSIPFRVFNREGN